MPEEVKPYNMKKMPVALRMEAKSMAAKLGITLEEFVVNALKIRLNLDREVRLEPSEYIGMFHARQVTDRVFETVNEVVFVGQHNCIVWPRRDAQQEKG